MVDYVIAEMDSSNYTISEYCKGHAFEDILWPISLHLEHWLGAQLAWTSTNSN